MVAMTRAIAVRTWPAAIDALCLMYTLTKYSKEAMFPHTGTWTLNENIMVGGQCTSDNLPPRLAVIQYSWRSPTLDIQERVFRRARPYLRSLEQARRDADPRRLGNLLQPVRSRWQ